MSMKNSNDTLGNRTRDLPTCRAVPQPTAPPHAPSSSVDDTKSFQPLYAPGEELPTRDCMDVRARGKSLDEVGINSRSPILWPSKSRMSGGVKSFGK